MRNKGRRSVRVLTAGGEIELHRPYFWSPQEGGSCPADQATGLEDGRVSRGAREILCRLGMVQNFVQAAEDAGRIGNIPTSKERLRKLVEGEAKAIARLRNGDQIKASWSSVQARVSAEGPTRVYGGVDGVMVATVTQQEKGKRRKAHAVRRQQRSAAGLGNTRPLPAAREGSDDRYKEMKIGLFYDQSKRHRHAFATEGDHEALGALLKTHADQVAFEKAQQSISLTDGAKWIARQLCLRLLGLKAMLLDFYHLSEHVHEAAKCCLGETAEARAWASARLREIKECGVTPVLAAIDDLRKKVRSPSKQRSLQLLRDYIVARLEMVDYRGTLAKGWDIGSGPTEAMCKNLTLRLKRPGMKWDRDNAAAMMNLTALYESDQAKTYWAHAA